MIRSNLLVVLAVLSISSTGCYTLDLSDPVQAKSDAEMAGNFVTFAYLLANRDAVSDASKYLASVVAIEALMAEGSSESSFVSRHADVRKLIAAQLKGDDAVFIPPASALARLLLLELDRKAGAGGWRDNATVAADVVAAFLKGVKAALTDFIPVQ